MAPKGAKNKFDREVIEKRIWYMKEFLLSLCDNPQLRSSPVFEKFLSEPDPEKFAKYQKDVDKIVNPNNVFQSSCLTRKMLSGKNPPKIEHFINKDGESHLKVSPELKTYSEAVVLLLKEISPAMTEYLLPNPKMQGLLKTTLCEGSRSTGPGHQTRQKCRKSSELSEKVQHYGRENQH